jgi:hypothetical protein
MTSAVDSLRVRTQLIDARLPICLRIQQARIW